MCGCEITKQANSVFSEFVCSQAQLCHMRCIYWLNRQLHVSACTGHLQVLLAL